MPCCYTARPHLTRWSGAACAPLDPRRTANAKAHRALALIQQAYAVDNPRKFAGYGADCWGRSAGVNSGGGRATPRDDNGTINVMASLASMPYTPAESLAALRHFYRDLGPKIWGPWGFYDGFNETQNHFDPDYMARSARSGNSMCTTRGRPKSSLTSAMGMAANRLRG